MDKKNVNRITNHEIAPLISVIMPVYNIELYIKESIDSILNQTFNDFEFIIIDDASTDSTAKIIHTFTDKRITFLQNEVNLGNYPSRNIGMRMAKGKYIAVMDGDDISLPDRLDVQYRYMEEHTNVLACGSAYQIIDTKKVIIRPTEYTEIKYNLAGFFCMLHPTLFFRKKAVTELSFYNEQYPYSADYEIICRLALSGPIVNLKDVLLKHREHEKQISSSHFSEQDQYARLIQYNYQQEIGLSLSDADFLNQLALYIESISRYAYPGLFYGKMGMVLFFFHYAKQTQIHKYEEVAFELLLNIQQMIHKETSIDLADGLSGIALGILYLLEHGFIEGDADEILEEMDRKIANETFQYTDTSFESGLTGILCYVLYRLKSRKKEKEYTTFNTTYLKKLFTISEKWMENTANYSEPSFTLDWNRLLKDIIEPLPTDKSIANWLLGLKNGCAGMGLYKMINSNC